MANFATGWIEDPREVGRVLNSLPHPLLAATEWAADLKATEHRDVMFWVIEKEVIGKVLPPHFQQRGTCVGQGFARATQHLIQAEIAMNEHEEWIDKVLPASIYGPSRVEIGGGRVNGDGSVGAWAAKSVSTYGVLLGRKYGSIDCRGGDDDNLCVEWGRKGMPDELEPIAREHLVADVSLVNDAEIGAGCLYNLKPIAVCSNQGFTTARDEYAMCQPKGSWAHCMSVGGILKIKHPQHPSGRVVIAIVQSWGPDNPSGNRKVTLQSGEPIEVPPGVFLIDIEVWENRMLRAGDSWALAGMSGWHAVRDDFLFA